MKVAIVHDWLVDFGGAEKVLRSIMNIYPEADVYSLVCGMNSEELALLGIKKEVNTSFIQRMPFGVRKYKNYLLFMPIAIQQFDLSKYDLILSSSYCVAKGVITGPDQTHICYCHSPVRYAWDLQSQYLRESKIETGIKSVAARYILNKIRDFDVRSSNAVDWYVANSNFIKKRIGKFYRRDATVIYPPVETSCFSLKEKKSNYYVTCSRLVPYKKVGLIVEAFNDMPDKNLIVVGNGPEFENIKSIANRNVEMVGYASFETLIEYMRSAKAFVYAAEEDFGIVPVEAQAAGTPVIGYGKGGLLDTVIDGKTGIYFLEQTADCIKKAVFEFEKNENLMASVDISIHAEKFSKENFEIKFSEFVKSKLMSE